METQNVYIFLFRPNWTIGKDKSVSSDLWTSPLRYMYRKRCFIEHRNLEFMLKNPLFHTSLINSLFEWQLQILPSLIQSFENKHEKWCVVYPYPSSRSRTVPHAICLISRPTIRCNHSKISSNIMQLYVISRIQLRASIPHFTPHKQ